MFKNKTLVLALFCLVFKTALSQKVATSFGEFTPEEISMTRCDFDTGAVAVILLDKAASTPAAFSKKHREVITKQTFLVPLPQFL